ncbi:hypothetical protein GCM10011584_03430 [Nocardioides phosphati]|uniref:Uncharacterized protein n=1 Tax=Nocardioides phosphati TaxID=1867775 RepID=A0ABQ2N576_9ACTN|nr:hypothetical protein [Nocardioides phosphati]GGO84857.1 hypothetical protein GCM10011584_03430 [Nocardioides phosphati]
MTPPTAAVLPPEVERSTEMYVQSHLSAREIAMVRRAEAERERRGQLLSRAVRLGLRAERAAYDARRVLARL